MLQRRAGQVTQVYFLTRSGGLHQHQQQQELNALMKAFPSFFIRENCRFDAVFQHCFWEGGYYVGDQLFYGSLLYSIEIDLILWLLKSHILTPFLHTNIKVNQNQLELCENYFAGEITMMLMIKRCVDQYGCNL